MLKSFWKVVAFAFVLLLVGGAQAAEMRTLQYANGEAFQSFFKAMETNGWADAEVGIDIDGMALIAFGDAKVKGLVTESDRDAFIKLFRQRNGLSGKYISTEAFRAVSSGKGFFTGSLQDMRQAMSNLAPVAKAVPAETALQQSPAENAALAKRVSESKQEIAVLKSKQEALEAGLKAVNESKNSLKQLFDRTIDSVNRNVNALRKGEFTGAMGQVIDERAKAQFEAGSAAQKATDAAQDANIAAAKSAATDASVAAKGAVGSVNWFVTSFSVWFLLLTIVVVGVLIWLGVMSKKVWKLGNVVFGKGTIPSLSKKVEELEIDMQNVEPAVSKQGHRLDTLEQSHEQLIERVGRSFDEELIQPSKLKALPIGGRIEVALEHPHDEDNKVYLEVERSADDKVTVHGALRQLGQTAPLVVDSLAGVPSAINKAAKAGRIVGVQPNVLTFRRAA